MRRLQRGHRSAWSHKGYVILEIVDGEDYEILKRKEHLCFCSSKEMAANFIENDFQKAEKQTEFEALRKIRNNPCKAKGDVGYPNVWGSPYLKFDISLEVIIHCGLEKGHKDKHSSLQEVRVTQSFENERGLSMDGKSIEVENSSFYIRWNNKEDAASKDKKGDDDASNM